MVSEGSEFVGNGDEISIISCTPGVDVVSQFETLTRGVGAIILIAFASGTTKDELAPIIAQRIAEGIPVFILVDAIEDDFGPALLRYHSGQAVLDAGAVLLAKITTKHADALRLSLQEAIANGLRGSELQAYIVDLYCYGENEIPPVPEVSSVIGEKAMIAFTRRALKRSSSW